jgi:hypothetical protein
MLRYETPTTAAPAAVWPLMARPDRWHEWAWHVRGAWGLGDPEVRAGARGVVRLLGVVLTPVRITDVVPGRSWSWRAGPLVFHHRVDPLGASGSTVGIDIDGPAVLMPVVKRTYGPLCLGATRALAERAATLGGQRAASGW